MPPPPSYKIQFFVEPYKRVFMSKITHFFILTSLSSAIKSFTLAFSPYLPFSISPLHRSAFFPLSHHLAPSLSLRYFSPPLPLYLAPLLSLFLLPHSAFFPPSTSLAPPLSRFSLYLFLLTRSSLFPLSLLPHSAPFFLSLPLSLSPPTSLPLLRAPIRLRSLSEFGQASRNLIDNSLSPRRHFARSTRWFPLRSPERRGHSRWLWECC